MLETIWFVLWALLWAVYFILDGFDLGLGALLPFLGKNESERRIMYNAAGNPGGCSGTYCTCDRIGFMHMQHEQQA